MSYINFLEIFRISLIVLIVLFVYVAIEQFFMKKSAIKRRKKYLDEYERKNKRY